MPKRVKLLPDWAAKEAQTETVSHYVWDTIPTKWSDTPRFATRLPGTDAGMSYAQHVVARKIQKWQTTPLVLLCAEGLNLIVQSNLASLPLSGGGGCQ